MEIRSGRWDWSVQPQSSGAAVVFRHRSRHGDELRTWSPDVYVTDERAAELALQPIERRWTDPDGISWTIQIELPSDWGRESRGPSSLRLVFAIGSLTRTVTVPEDCRVGELTHLELKELLQRAH